ncbi:MAG TPA: alpha/beta hydrolase [Trueperaceae bacterium]|mgnify:CR=1 FL=1|nr:alpha/beta hydrolase [Trueperaceae bacterium]
MDPRSFRRTAAAVVALAAVALAAAQPSLPPPPGRLVDVGGRSLHVYCVGEGSPTVVLEAGLGDGSIGFRSLQSRVAGFTRVCAYDRAGYGWSDPADDGRDLAAVVADLEALLSGAGEPGPYVLAGHSFGGLVAVAFAHVRPQDVAGVVLIDSSHPEQMAALAAVPEIVELQRAEIEGLAGVVDMAEQGTLTPDIVRPNAPPDLRPDLQDAWARLFVQPKQLRAAVAEFAAIDDSFTQAGAAMDLGDTPVIVLSRGLGLDAQLPAEALAQLGLTPEVLARFDATWDDLQADLVTVSTDAKRVVAERGTHYVYRDQPALVAAAIRELVREAR